MERDSKECIFLNSVNMDLFNLRNHPHKKIEKKKN